jgi:hypothetical protein
MKKTVFPSMKEVVDDITKIERDLRDVRTVLCLIAYQQDDKTLHVPFAALEAMPKGLELEISVDRVHGNYEFKCVLPKENEDDTVASEL